MSSHLLKHVVPSVFVSAVVVVLTLGVAIAQAAVPAGRGARINVPAAGHGATNVGFVIASVVILALALGGILYAVLADRRQLSPASAAGEPTRLPSDSSDAEHERKAA
jgi:hypothetical protein